MRKNINLVLGAPLLVIALILPLIFPDTYFLHSAAMILYFAYMATSWNFICGYVGQLSLGHAAFSGAAGYVSVLLFTGVGLSPWLGMVLGGILDRKSVV